MYRLIFLVLFSIPISGMFSMQRHPSPDRVTHTSNCSFNTYKDMIQAENFFVKRTSQRSNDSIKFEFEGERNDDNGQKVPLNEAEAELYFNLMIRKHCLVQQSTMELLNKLKS